MSSDKNFFLYWFNKKPFLVQPFTAGVLFFIGDYACQFLMHRKKQLIENKKLDFYLEKKRSIRQVSFAILTAPYTILHHLFLIPKYIPLNSKFRILKFIAWDVTFVVLPFQFTYFTYNSLLIQGKINKNYIIENQRRAFALYCMFWCPLSIINFRYIKREYRFFFIGFLSSIWQIFLSFLANDAEKNKCKPDANSTFMEHLFFNINKLIKKIEGDSNI